MVDTQAAVTGLERQSNAPTRLFTTWFTSGTDKLDHAVTDEAVVANRFDPTAVCDAPVALMPMAYPNQPRCQRCAAIVGGSAYRGEPRTAGRVSGIRVILPRLLHPNRWIGPRSWRERSHFGLSYLLSGPPVPAQRDRTQTPVTAMSVRRAATGYVATSVSDPVPETDVSPQPSSAVEQVSGARPAVPSAQACSARHAGRDGSQPLVHTSSVPRWPKTDQDCPVEAATPSHSRRRLHQDDQMSAGSRAKGWSGAAATTGAVPPDAPVVDDGAATPTASPATSR